jgi:hypothetical protein
MGMKRCARTRPPFEKAADLAKADSGEAEPNPPQPGKPTRNAGGANGRTGTITTGERDMKLRLEGTTLEDIDTFVRITLGNGKVECTKSECPTAVEVAGLLAKLQGFWPNRAQLQACSRVAERARNNKLELCLEG